MQPITTQHLTCASHSPPPPNHLHPSLWPPLPPPRPAPLDHHPPALPLLLDARPPGITHGLAATTPSCASPPTKSPSPTPTPGLTSSNPNPATGIYQAPVWYGLPPGLPPGLVLATASDQHAVLRRYLSPVFPPRAIQAQEPVIRAYADLLLTWLRGLAGGEVDVVP